MKESTSNEYKKIAEGFYKTHLGGQPPTLKRLKNALKKLEGDVRPNYWRKLKIAIAHDQAEKGYKDVSEGVGGLVNQLAKDAESRKDYSGIKPRTALVKGVNEADQAKIEEALKAKGDQQLQDAYALALFTGARPVEMSCIEVENGEVVISGAKCGMIRDAKGNMNQRGFERRSIKVPAGRLAYIEKAVERLEGANIGAMQDRFERLMKKTFPRRKKRPTLYSLRHQLGSDLKRSGLDRESIAYCMGHRSTKSVEVYGDRRTGGVKCQVKPGDDFHLLERGNVKVNHKEPFFNNTQEATAESVINDSFMTENDNNLQVNHQPTSIDSLIEDEINSWLDDEPDSPSL